MVEWLLSLFFTVAPLPATTEQDYIAAISAEVAYAALLPGPTPTKPKVPTKDCKTCNGTGRVRTGDDHAWTKCPDCEGLPTLRQQNGATWPAAALKNSP